MVAFIVLTLNSLLFALYLLIRVPKLNIPQGLALEERMPIIDDWLKKVHRRGKFNGAVLLAKNGKVLLSKSYGYNSEAANTLLNDRSAFNLASVSKQFTAMAVLLLEYRSKLSLDDSVATYIPELSFYSTISIRHLLTHTNGIPDYMRLVSQHTKDDPLVTTEKVLTLFQSKQPKCQFEPGAKFAYSNTGYVLLAEIVHRVSGRSFPDFMAAEIFQPLGMHDSLVFNRLCDQEPAVRVYGYGKKYGLLGGATQSRDLNEMDGVFGDGSVYSSASDLALWDGALRNGTLIPLEKIRQAYQPVTLSSGKLSNYGFGWFVNPNDNSVEHAGGWQGFSSYIFRDLTNEGLIVVLDNSSNAIRVPAFGFLFNSISKNLKKAMVTG